MPTYPIQPTSAPISVPTPVIEPEHRSKSAPTPQPLLFPIEIQVENFNFVKNNYSLKFDIICKKSIFCYLRVFQLVFIILGIIRIDLLNL